MKRETILSAFFLVLLGFVLYQVARILVPFFSALFWAAVLAFACYPLHDRVKRTRLGNNAAAFLTTTAVLLVVLPATALVTVTLVGQASQLYRNARDYVESGRLEETIEEARETEWFQLLEEHLVAGEIRDDPKPFAMKVVEGLGGFGSIAEFLARLGQNLVLFLANLVLMVALLFFFFRDGPKIHQFVYEATPIEKENKDVIFQRIEDTFTAVIRGQFVTSLVQGILAGILYWILGIPLPILFGFLTAAGSLIPVTGAASIWFPWAVYLVATGDTLRGIVLVVGGFLGISLADNFLKPVLIGERTRIPILLLFLGILGGLRVWGFTGVFLAPLLLSLMFVLIRQARERYEIS